MVYLSKTPSIVKSIFPAALWSVNTSEKELYLTFDDGPTPGVTDWVLDLLKEYNALGTFFCIGKNVVLNKTLYDRLIEEGHRVGNHTYDHLNSWKQSKGDYVSNIESCSEQVDSKLFRPPYGKLQPGHYRAIKQDYKIVLWDVLSGDFDTRIDGKKCSDNVIKNAEKGSIIVFHDSVKAFERLKVALPATLEHFSKLGFDFKPLP